MCRCEYLCTYIDIEIELVARAWPPGPPFRPVYRQLHVAHLSVFRRSDLKHDVAQLADMSNST